MPKLRTRIKFLPRTRRATAVVTLLTAFVICCGVQPGSGQEPESHSPDGANFFNTKVLPILSAHCLDCHSHESGESSGQLMLDSLAAMQLGGTRGPSLSANKPLESWLYKAISYEDSELQMPPDGKLPEESIAILGKWLEMGNPVPSAWKGNLDALKSSTEGQEKLIEQHWAYQPLQSVAPGRNIDELLDTQLMKSGLARSPRATRQTLIRRAHYDLLGLPPTLEQCQAFEKDSRDDRAAFEALIEQLLASPHFGERWARHWMDIARYADNKGYVFQEDREYKEAYRYRNWLIDAFNQDLPFDRFVTQQVAADLLPDNEQNLPALGFVTLGRRFLNNQFDIIDDRLDVVARGLMGMTLACARCHDHKYDPISQKDYYSMAGVFFNTEEPGGAPWAHRLAEREKMRPAFVLKRGSPGNRGEQVPRRFVRFLSSNEPDFPSDTSGRLQLAEQITAPDNPLTARVWANRVWMYLTGKSLVQTPSDFGIRCPPPEQAELLDYLACTLQQSGWSVKSLIREIVLSDTYAQASRAHDQGLQLDPENTFYWRMNRRRLDFEALRDAVLFRTGQLDLTVYGPSEKIEQQPFPQRRTVYAYIDRQNLPGVFRTFDMASPDTHAPRRPSTTVPQQGLYMLNSQFVVEQAQHLAKRVARTAHEKGEIAAVEWMFYQVLARTPTAQEVTWFHEFIAENENGSSEERWAQLVQVLLASNELCFID